MSLKKHTDAFLRGYNKPEFPAVAGMLQKVLREKGAVTGVTLEGACKTVEGFVELDRPSTSDGYVWFWALNFRTNDGKVAILVPWAQDWDQTDGALSDRALAIYTSGNVSDVKVESIVTKVIDGVHAQANLRALEAEEDALIGI